MWGKGKFETGAKMTWRQNNIDHKMFEWNDATQDWVLSIPLSNDLTHREYIPAAYAMYSGKFTEKLNYKAGLRFEYSYVTLHSIKEALDDHSNIGLTIRPFNGTDIQAQYFVTTPQYFPQFTTRTIHYGNVGVKQSFKPTKGAQKNQEEDRSIIRLGD